MKNKNARRPVKAAPVTVDRAIRLVQVMNQGGHVRVLVPSQQKNVHGATGSAVVGAALQAAARDGFGARLEAEAAALREAYPGVADVIEAAIAVPVAA